MRITNSMIRNNVLWNINKNEIMMHKYEMQLSTGKKIQKPSDDPVVAIRALKFRTNISEIAQYKTNSEDAISWMSVTEQGLSNTYDMLSRVRELAVQGASDTYTTRDRQTIIEELKQLKGQLANEGNVNYAGRYVFTGFKTSKPLSFTDESTDVYEITEHFTPDSIEAVKRVQGGNILDVNRIRLAYSDVGLPTVPTAIAGFTIYEMNSTDGAPPAPAAGTSPIEPAVDEIYFLKDTGELIFNGDNVNGVAPAAALPANLDFLYEKTNFVRGDMVPEQYFDCTNTTTGDSYLKTNDEMIYQISYNQEIVVNTLGNGIFSKDLLRDLEEIINATNDIMGNGAIDDDLKSDLLGDYFDELIGKMDQHLNILTRSQAVIGSKINVLNLTINRLDEDEINFTDLLSKNEDADMTEAVLRLQAQEIVYNASLMSSSKIMQQSLLDFIR